MNENRSFFQNIYPERWLANRSAHGNDADHYYYQEIALDRLEVFDGCLLLECGCGSGDLLARLRSRHPRLGLFGVDLARPSMVWANEGPLRKAKVSFIEGDLITLPLPSERFDRILCSSVLWYVPNPGRVIDEMIRVLKPGGRFVFDVRNPWHFTNLLTRVSLKARRIAGQKVPYYSFETPSSLSARLNQLPVSFIIEGFFVLLPTRLPLLGKIWGNWARFSPRLSFETGQSKLNWLAQKLLVTGSKLW